LAVNINDKTLFNGGISMTYLSQKVTIGTISILVYATFNKWVLDSVNLVKARVQ